MQILLKQKISNHPKFPNVKREVVVYGPNIDGRFEQIVLDAEVRYYDENEQDITAMFKSKLDWVVNNKDLTTVRDSKGKPVPNPQFREAPAEGEDDRTPEEKEPYLKQPSFDYFAEIIKAALSGLLALHIQQNDEIKFFDEIL